MNHHNLAPHTIDRGHQAPADIRRRRRIMHGVPSYTIKVLFESLHLHGHALRNARIALLGFTFDDAHPHAHEIRAELMRRGAHVVVLDAPASRQKLDDDLMEEIKHVDAVIIATEHPVFRAIRPREFRAAGVDIVIPTTTRAH